MALNGEHRDKHFKTDVQYNNPDKALQYALEPTRLTILYIRSLPDHVVMEALRNENSKSYQYLAEFIWKVQHHKGFNINPYWNYHQLVIVAYDRGLIDWEEYDKLIKGE
jgi:hypothetical protein